MKHSDVVVSCQWSGCHATGQRFGSVLSRLSFSVLLRLLSFRCNKKWVASLLSTKHWDLALGSASDRDICCIAAGSKEIMAGQYRLWTLIDRKATSLYIFFKFWIFMFRYFRKLFRLKFSSFRYVLFSINHFMVDTFWNWYY